MMRNEHMAPTSAYGEKIRALMNAQSMVPSKWVKIPPRQIYRQGLEVSPVVANQLAWKGSWTQRDTIALCKDSSHRRVLCGVNWVTEGKLLGRDVEPRVGMTVQLTEQGRERRNRARARAGGGAAGSTAAAWRAKENLQERPWTGYSGEDPGNNIGVVTGVGSTWTCDVLWRNGQTGVGYSCGGSGGKVGRAFHLQLIDEAPLQRRRIISDAEVRAKAKKQFGTKCQVLR